MRKTFRYSARTTVFSFLLLLLVGVSRANTFELTGIGSLDTGGSRYTDWWYTGSNALLRGTGDADVDITITVGEDEYMTETNSDGNWEYYLELETGDYAVQIDHDANDSYSFNLHLGQAVPADLGGTTEASESTTAVPMTGFNQVVGLSLGAGVALLGFYFYVANDPKRKLAFEKRFLRD